MPTCASTVTPIRCASGVSTGLGAEPSTISQVPLTSRITPGRIAPTGQGAAQVVVPAEHHRRSDGQTGGLRRGRRHLAKHRAAGIGIGQSSRRSMPETASSSSDQSGFCWSKSSVQGGHGVVRGACRRA